MAVRRSRRAPARRSVRRAASRYVARSVGRRSSSRRGGSSGRATTVRIVMEQPRAAPPAAPLNVQPVIPRKARF